MPKFRVTLPVTLLIETSSSSLASTNAGWWSASMIQATHGVELQPIPEQIRAVHFDMKAIKTDDITVEFDAYVDKQNHEAGPDGLAWTKAFANFNVGLQPYWNGYLQDPKGSLAGTRVRYLCTHCGAWREARTVNLISALVEGTEPGSAEEEEIHKAKKKEFPFIVRHAKECVPKGGMVVGVYPDDERWDKLDPEKRED